MHVLVLGSSVIDLFLTADSKFTKIIDRTVSFDLGAKIPTDIKLLALGGNGGNVSVGLTRLEVPTTFYTYLGKDILSREVEEGLSREGVELVIDKDRTATSPFSIIFDFDSDRIIFSHHQKGDYSFNFEKRVSFDFIYLTSVGESFTKAYEQILGFAKSNNIPIAFSPGVHQIENKNDLVNDVLKNSKIYFSNREEATRITTDNEHLTTDIKELLTKVKASGPEVVSITDGANGAYAADQNGNMYFIKPLETEEAAERTGAGDAYAAGFFASYLYGNDVPSSMKWGVLNAQAVMQKIGAQNGLLTKQELDELLKKNNNLEAQQI